MRKILMISLISLCFASSFQWYPANALTKDNEGGQCRKDEDCVFVGNACVSGAVNKRYKATAERKMLGIDRDMKNCAGALAAPERKAFCRQVVIECSNRYDREKGKICYDDTGICDLR